MQLVVIQWHTCVNAQLNDRSWNIAVARQRAMNRGLVALQRHRDSRIFNFRQIVHVWIRVGLRLRGPRFLPRERIARQHGVLLCLRELRAVAFVFQNFGLAPLV